MEISIGYRSGNMAKPQSVQLDDNNVGKVTHILDNGNVRLAVDSTLNPVPVSSIIPKKVCLMNGSTKNMDVDGSSSPVEYKYAPGAGEIWFVNAIAIFFLDSGLVKPDRFGAITGGLTNGVDVIIKLDGVENNIISVKNNVDINLAFEIKFKINDDLTSIDYLQSAVEIWREK